MVLRKYIDRLFIPKILSPKYKGFGQTYYEVRMQQFTKKLHSDFKKETTLWGYEGSYPGPTIEVKRGEKVKIKWINELPDKHFLPVDKTLHGAEPRNPEVRTVVHLHGANVESQSDGYPEAWFTKNFKEHGPYFKKKIYEYTNDQPATTLWYHDHAMGITRLNVYAGLSGFYIIRDNCEAKLNLPCGKYEIPLIIQDKLFTEDGSLLYPAQPNNPAPGLPNPSVLPGFAGDTIVVNGIVWPFHEVEPRKYRFRVLNASNARIYTFKRSIEGENTSPPWTQIGSDGGLFDIPVPLTTLTLAPSERADLIIDFSNFKNKNIQLVNDAVPLQDPTHSIMEFRVNVSLEGKDDTDVPSHLCPISRIPEYTACKVRDMAITVNRDEEYPRPLFQLNNKMFTDPITETPVLGTTEIWRIINPGLFPHPIHVHLVQFQILDKQPFDIALYNSSQGKEIVFTGPRVLPDLNERGWKDTVRATPGQITRIIARFGDYSGLYVWHCHILEHEDHEMMRPLLVIKHD
jgi:spore coat protein A